MATIDEHRCDEVDNTQFKAPSRRDYRRFTRAGSTIDSGATKSLGSALGSTFSNALRVN